MSSQSHEVSFTPETIRRSYLHDAEKIRSQPTAFQNAIAGRVSADGKNAILSGFELRSMNSNLDRINLVACGTAFAAKLGVQYIRV